MKKLEYHSSFITRKESKMAHKIEELVEFIENDSNKEYYKDKHDLIIRKINEMNR